MSSFDAAYQSVDLVSIPEREVGFTLIPDLETTHVGRFWSHFSGNALLPNGKVQRMISKAQETITALYRAERKGTKEIINIFDSLGARARITAFLQKEIESDWEQGRTPF